MVYLRPRILLSSLLLTCLVNMTGCGQGDRPPMGYVSGNVTIDDEPLSGVIVLFTPESGRPATALTDSNGAYRLQYVSNVYGCKIGSNTVSFVAPTSGTPSHPIPARYQGKSDWKVEVKKGNNTFDLPLETDTSSKPAALKPAGTKKAAEIPD